MVKDEPLLYLYLWHEHEEAIHPLRFEEEIPYDEEDLPHRVRAIVPVRCGNCTLDSLWDDYFLESDQQAKAMGIKTSFEMIIETSCPRCERGITARITITHYAGNFTFEEYDCKRCSLVEIQGLDDIIVKLNLENLDLNRTLEGLHEESQSMQWEIETLNRITSHNSFSPKYVLVSEGKDDIFVWRGLLQNCGIEPDYDDIRILHGLREGGFEEAVATFSVIKKMRLRCKSMLVVDSDNNKDEVIKKLKKHAMPRTNYHVLERKEIESYLFDAGAIASITGISEHTINDRIKEIGTTGKSQLDQLFKSLDMMSPDEQVKYLIARRLTIIPSELQEVIEDIRQNLR